MQANEWKKKKLLVELFSGMMVAHDVLHLICVQIMCPKF